MCGITGIIAKRAFNPAALEAMTARLVHRGPDGEGHWISSDGCVGFGHRRLAIIDTTDGGAQPMTDTSGRYIITFNGEIYNYIELAERLKVEGVIFRSKSDTEVLLEAYKTWGEACLDELNGMFAFAIFDTVKQTLFCSRDRFGEKPFYYTETDDYFAFASEYKALFALADLPIETNDERVLRFLHNSRQGLDDDPETAFWGITQLLPAESMRMDLRDMKPSIRRYWNIEPTDGESALSFDQAAEQFKDLLQDSVKFRMRSDVPVGSCLSGGLDSSAIVCLNRRILGTGAEYHTFTGQFPGSPADESEFADIVVKSENVTPHLVEPTAEGFAKDLADFIWFNELPVGSSSQYAQWCVFKLAKQNNVTVLLDGQGADEIMGGYEQYFSPYLKARAQMVSTGDVAAEKATIEARYPAALLAGNDTWKGRVPMGLRWPLANLLGKGSDFLFGVSLDLAPSLARANQRQTDNRFNPLMAALKDDSLHAHLPTLLRYGDRNSMAHSRETRLPFCDHRLAEFVFSLSPETLMGNAETKRLLRGAMQNILPVPIRTRWNKQGFRPPQEAWFSGALKQLAQGTFESGAFRQRGYWNTKWWQSAWTRFNAGQEHLAWTLWKPVIAESWQTHFVDRLKSEPRVSVFH